MVRHNLSPTAHPVTRFTKVVLEAKKGEPLRRHAPLSTQACPFLTLAPAGPSLHLSSVTVARACSGTHSAQSIFHVGTATTIEREGAWGLSVGPSVPELRCALLILRFCSVLWPAQYDPSRWSRTAMLAYVGVLLRPTCPQGALKLCLLNGEAVIPSTRASFAFGHYSRPANVTVVDTWTRVGIWCCAWLLCNRYSATPTLPSDAWSMTGCLDNTQP